MNKRLGFCLILIVLSIITGCARPSNVERPVVRENERIAIPDQNATEDDVEVCENPVETLEAMDMKPGEAYTIMGFISSYEPETRILSFNIVEWISTKERATEVGINYDSDMPSGFYIYDADNFIDQLHVSDDACYTMLNESTPMEVSESVLWEFVDYMKVEGFNYPFEMRILNDEITKIDQVYLP